jgi:hypothetical protein
LALSAFPPLTRSDSVWKRLGFTINKAVAIIRLFVGKDKKISR